MASIKAAKGQEAVVETKLVRQFPSLTFLPIGDALAQVGRILSSLGNAVAIVGGLAVVTGIFVLAGALSVGRKQREADATVMKVLGATRRDVIVAFVIEYGLLGVLAALLAAGLGVAGAAAAMTYLLKIPPVIDPVLVTGVTTGAVLLSVITGILTTWSSMSVRPSRQLRGEGA
jgi:putative ABC transport system permease protein